MNLSQTLLAVGKFLGPLAFPSTARRPTVPELHLPPQAPAARAFASFRRSSYSAPKLSTTRMEPNQPNQPNQRKSRKRRKREHAGKEGPMNS
jgi:hypothetical protein